MKLPRTITPARHARRAFMLVEVLMAMAIVAVVVGVFYSALTHGFNLLRMEFEDRRATQILMEKAESIRLCRWDQVTSNGFIPSTFTVTYDAAHTNSGVTYAGTILLANPPINAPYTNALKAVTIRLNWTTGRVARQRELKTLVARYGLQTYVD